jgi:uncharacterized RDD family membrane protein YckC
MPNEQLLAHIRAELARGVDRTAIIQSLIAAGWKVEDLNAAMTVVDQGLSTSASSITQVPQSQYAYVAPAVQTVKYAGFWVRTAAFFVDVLVLSIPIMAISFLVFGKTLSDTVYDYSDFVPTIGFFIIILFTVTKYQATPGKMIVGLQIQRTNGERIGFGRVFLREIIGKLLSAISLSIGYLMIAWTGKKQGLHDKIADTVVIERNPNKSKTGWMVFAALMLSVLIIGFGIFGAIIGVAIKSELSNASGLTGAESQQMIVSKATTVQSGETTVFIVNKYPKDAVSWSLRLDCSTGVSAMMQSFALDGKTLVGKDVNCNEDVALNKEPYSKYPQLIIFGMRATVQTSGEKTVTIVSKTFDSSNVLLNQSSIPITVQVSSGAIIQSVLSKSRTIAEIYYSNRDNYSGVCTKADGVLNEKNELAKISSSVVCKDSLTAWAMSAQLESDTLKYWCADSTGTSAVQDSVITTTSCK